MSLYYRRNTLSVRDGRKMPLYVGNGLCMQIEYNFVRDLWFSGLYHGCIWIYITFVEIQKVQLCILQANKYIDIDIENV